MPARPIEPSAGMLAAAPDVAVVAGSGDLPMEVACALTAATGRSPFVVVLEGSVARFAQFPHAELPVEDLGGLVPLLKRRGIVTVVLAGGVTRRPRLGRMRWRLELFKVARRFVVPLARGDDNLLKAAVRYLESSGLRVIGAHDVIPDLVASEGAMTEREPAAADRRDIEAGLRGARALGMLDIGQAAVAVGGRIIALEDIAGTDSLLERVAMLRGHGRLAGRTGGVLVKCSKPGQELRADLPAVGPATVDMAHAAGLNGIAVEAGRTLMLDRGKAVARADALGLFIVGVARRDAA